MSWRRHVLGEVFSYHKHKAAPHEGRKKKLTLCGKVQAWFKEAPTFPSAQADAGALRDRLVTLNG